MNTFSIRVLFAAVVMLVSMASCSDKPGMVENETVSPKTYFAIKVGDRPVSMQLAISSTEMQRGLMGRRDLMPDQGMLFLYTVPTRMGFWMHNTPTPLDIGFFSPEGELMEIYPLHPYDEKTVSSRGDRLQYALEVNRGWFKANGVKPGDKLDIGALAKAIKDRGAEPHVYGIR